MAAMHRVAALQLEDDRNNPHAAANRQTRLSANAQPIKRRNGQTTLSANVKTTKHSNSQIMLSANVKTIKRHNKQTALRANRKILKRANHQTHNLLNAKTRLLYAGIWQHTGLPANVKTLQQDYSQPLKQG
jgi:uncharacterized cupin superfamily protein